VVRIRDPEKKSSRILIPDPWGKKAPDPGSATLGTVMANVIFELGKPENDRDKETADKILKR
jgi:hypothetical protein